jgi:hypothetical protein
MKLIIKKCHTCKALGVGPLKVKLWPFENRLYCQEHYHQALTWDESRSNVTNWIKSEFDFEKAVALVRKWGRKDPIVRVKNWRAYIQECSELAAWAFDKDRRTFVYYFARAVYAWALKEEA